MRRPSANWNVVRAELPKSFEPAMSGMGPDSEVAMTSQRVRSTPAHYRSYDPASRTYTGYDGQRRSCP
jgi:hypothetical protein